MLGSFDVLSEVHQLHVAGLSGIPSVQPAPIQQVFIVCQKHLYEPDTEAWRVQARWVLSSAEGAACSCSKMKPARRMSGRFADKVREFKAKNLPS